MKKEIIEFANQLKGEFAVFMIESRIGEKLTEYQDFEEITHWWLNRIEKIEHALLKDNK